MNEKACRTCRRVVEQESKCPACGGTTFTTFWRGYVVILNHEESEIAKKMRITHTGKFALRLSR
ncbi:MAG: transcription elongation factor subunit Spt4 [archaeon]